MSEFHERIKLGDATPHLFVLFEIKDFFTQHFHQEPGLYHHSCVL